MSEHLDEIIGLGITRRIALEIGERIRLGRERSGKSIAEFSEHIKIREHYLMAIENGAWNALPQGVNGRGLIRIYAKELAISVPEIEPKIASGEVHSQVKVSVSKSEDAKPTVSHSAAHNPAHTRAQAPTRTKHIPRPVRSSRHEDENDHAIEATGELASLLGIEPKHQNKHYRPAMPQKEIVYENNVPVVSAEYLAQEMFITETESDFNANTNPVVTNSPSTEHIAAATVKERDPAPTPEPTRQEHAQDNIESTPIEKAPEEIRQENASPGTTKEEATASANQETTATASEEQKEIPRAWIQDDISEVVSPVIVKKAENTSTETQHQVISNYMKKSEPVSEPREPLLSKSLVIGFVAVVAAAIFVTVSLSRRPSSDDITAEQTPIPESTPTAAAAIEATPEVVATPAQAAAEQPASATNVSQPDSAESVFTAQDSLPPQPAPMATPAKAVLTFKSKVPVNIRVDGKQFFSGTHNEGDLEIAFTKTADIYIDDGSKATLNFAGWENHGSLGWAGRKRRVILNASPYNGKGRGQF